MFSIVYNTVNKCPAKEGSFERSANTPDGGEVQGWGEEGDPGGGVEENSQDIWQVNINVYVE